MLNINELNKAILEVCLTQYKKDAKEAHKLVENAGFSIRKEDGQFVVSNNSNYKEVRVARKYRKIVVYSNGRRRTEFPVENNTYDVKFDFYNYLTKPRNETYYTNYTYTPSQDKYHSLKSARWDVDYYNERVNKIQKEIDRLQKDLVYAVERRTEAKARYENRRRDLGLKEIF